MRASRATNRHASPAVCGGSRLPRAWHGHDGNRSAHQSTTPNGQAGSEAGLTAGRNAIEPIIGHMKEDGFLGRNFLKGAEGDTLNALLGGGPKHTSDSHAPENFFAAFLGRGLSASPRVSYTLHPNLLKKTFSGCKLP